MKLDNLYLTGYKNQLKMDWRLGLKFETMKLLEENTTWRENPSGQISIFGTRLQRYRKQNYIQKNGLQQTEKFLHSKHNKHHIKKMTKFCRGGVLVNYTSDTVLTFTIYIGNAKDFNIGNNINKI